MARTKECPVSGTPLKDNTMHPAEARMTRILLGTVQHRRERLPGKPRPLSQEDFGKRFTPAVSPRQVYNWETGRSKIPVHQIRRIRELKRQAMDALRERN